MTVTERELCQILLELLKPFRVGGDIERAAQHAESRLRVLLGSEGLSLETARQNVLNAVKEWINEPNKKDLMASGKLIDTALALVRVEEKGEQTPNP